MTGATLPIVVTLTLTLFSASVSSIRLGEWRDLSKTGSLSVLSQRTWSFNRSINLAYCARRTITVPLDGRPDYTTRLNSVLKDLGQRGGGSLKLDAGVYPHSGHIIIPSYVCLIGAGMGRTTIRLIDNAPKFRYSGSIRSMHTERVTVRDLTQDGNRGKQGMDKRRNYGRYGFFSELTNYLYLKNVAVRNNYGYGFDPHGSKKYWSYYLIIENCQAINNGLDGFTIDQTVHATIINGFAKDNVRHGYNIVTGTQLAIFRTSTSETNGKSSGVGFGFVAQNNGNYGTKSISFESCVVKYNFRGAFKLRDVTEVYVTDAKIIGNGDAVCYELSETRFVFLRRNTCTGVRSSRKFKLGVNATYSETGDKSRLVTTRAAPSTKSTVDSRPDPLCSRGKRAGNICCNTACLKCGGLGCGKKQFGPGAASCCFRQIRAANRTCQQVGFPCVM